MRLFVEHLLRIANFLHRFWFYLDHGVISTHYLTPRMPHAMVIILRQPWRTMVLRAIVSLGCELPNRISVHCTSDGVVGVSKKSEFYVASAMAAMVVTADLYVGVRGVACAVQIEKLLAAHHLA